MIFQIGAAIIGMYGENYKAKAAEIESKQRAKQMQIDRKINEASAMQQQNERFNQYVEARATNDAQFSFQLGGGESTSVDAFQKAQREIVDEDMRVSQRQQMFDSSSRTVAALIERDRGRNAIVAGRINTVTRLFQLGAQLEETAAKAATGGA